MSAARPNVCTTGTFCCICDYRDTLQAAMRGGFEQRCQGCTHRRCHKCGQTLGRSTDTVLEGGFPPGKGRQPVVITGRPSLPGERSRLAKLEDWHGFTLGEKS